METDRCNALTFLTFLHYVLAMYENQQIIMILDNAKTHHAKRIQPFLNLHKDRLTLVELDHAFRNPKSGIANRFHATREEIRELIFAFLEYIHDCPENILRLIGSMAMSEN